MDELPYIKRDIDDIWYNTKHNINEPKYASFLYKDSLKAIIELIQVAAMAKRFLHDVYGEDI
jgi:DNA-binding ferritin-like protein (Dps family)